MLQDTFKVTGQILLRRYDENGKLNLEREHKNLIVTAGKQLIASRLFCDTRPSIDIASKTMNRGIYSATVSSGGSGYQLNDQLTVFGGNGSSAIFKVTGVSSNAITSIEIIYGGEYSTPPTSPVTVTGGNGFGSSFTILDNQITSATIGFAAQLTLPYDTGAYVDINTKKYRVKYVTLSSIIIDTSDLSGTLGDAEQIDPLPNSNVKKMKVGQGDTVANLSDIALYTEIGSGVPLYSSALDFEDDKASVVYIAFFPAGTSTSITGLREAALVNASGEMLCRTVFPNVPKAIGESLEIFWTVTIN